MRAGPLSLIFSFGLTWLLTPLVRRWALRRGMVDRRGGRRLDRDVLPKGGGIAMYAAFWAVVLITLPFDRELFGLWLSTTILLGVGLIDDFYELDWWQKLVGQAVAAAVLIGSGERISFVTHPISGETVFIGLWGVPLTLAWLIALSNMINLIDGMDGLAAGVCAIGSIPLIVVASALGRYEAAVMAMAIAGAAGGFLPHNFYPARIIMGDAGAMFLGFTLGAVSVEGAVKGTTALALIVPILAFGLPILETLLSILRRVAAGKPFYRRDLDHIHHRLLAKGFTQRQAALTLYALSALMSWAAVIAFESSITGSILVFILVTAVAIWFTRRVGGLKGSPVQPISKGSQGL